MRSLRLCGILLLISIVIFLIFIYLLGWFKGGYADENLATLRKIVLKLLEEETSSKQGIAAKRLQAAFSSKYLRKVVGF